MVLYPGTDLCFKKIIQALKAFYNEMDGGFCDLCVF